MLTNLPKTINAISFLDNFDIGDVDASEDSLLKSEMCVCEIQPIRDFLRGNKSIILGHRGAGKTALFRLVSEGGLNFHSENKKRHIILPIDEELQFHTIHSIIKQRVKSIEGSMWLTYRFLWEFFLLYKIVISLDEKFNSPVPIKDIADKFRELFEGKEKKNTLADFIKAQKKTVGVKIDTSAAPLPVPDFYFSAEPIQEDTTDIFHDAITLNIGEYKRKINSFLKQKNIIFNVLIDKLDDFVLQKEYEIQRSIIQGLLYCERDYLGLSNIKLKIFIRTDIFKNLDFKQLMWEKISSRTIELKWSDDDIRDFLAKRIAFNYLNKLELDRISFVIDEESMYLDKSSPELSHAGDNNNIISKLLRILIPSKRDAYNARKVNFDDMINRDLICSLFPRKIMHKDTQGVEKQITFFKYLSSHFNLNNGQTTPRIILMFLQFCISNSREYYEKNHDEQELILHSEYNEYPLFKREIICASYCCLQNTMWNSAAKISEQWEDWVNIIRRNKKQTTMKYSYLKYVINPEDSQEFNHFLAFITHIGILICKNSEVIHAKRIYLVPIIFKKSFYS